MDRPMLLGESRAIQTVRERRHGSLSDEYAEWLGG